MAHLGNNSRQRRRGAKSADVESQNNAFNKKRNKNNDNIKIIGVIVVAVIFILILIYSLTSSGNNTNTQLKPQLLREAQRVIDINQNIVSIGGEEVKYAFSTPLNNDVSTNADVLILASPDYDVSKFARIGVFQTLSLIGYNVFGIDLFYNLPNLDGNNHQLIRFILTIASQIRLKKNIILICPKLSATLYGLPLIFSKDINIIGAAFLYPERALDYNINQIQTIQMPFLLVKNDNTKIYSYEKISNKNLAVVTVQDDNLNTFSSSLNNYLVKFLRSTANYKSQDIMQHRVNDLNRMSPELLKNKFRKEYLDKMNPDQLQMPPQFKERFKGLDEHRAIPRQQSIDKQRALELKKQRAMERQQQFNREIDPNAHERFNRKIKRDDINLDINGEYLDRNRASINNDDDTIKIHERLNQERLNKDSINFMRNNKANILKRQNAERNIFRQNKDPKRVS